MRDAPVCCVCAQASSFLNCSFDDAGVGVDWVGACSSILYCCCCCSSPSLEDAAVLVLAVGAVAR